MSPTKRPPPPYAVMEKQPLSTQHDGQIGATGEDWGLRLKEPVKPHWPDLSFIPIENAELRASFRLDASVIQDEFRRRDSPALQLAWCIENVEQGRSKGTQWNNDATLHSFPIPRPPSNA